MTSKIGRPAPGIWKQILYNVAGRIEAVERREMQDVLGSSLLPKRRKW